MIFTFVLRSVVIGKWINIGMKLSELNNFNAVMEIVSALHSAAVSRLHQSWGVSLFRGIWMKSDRNEPVATH